MSEKKDLEQTLTDAVYEALKSNAKYGSPRGKIGFFQSIEADVTLAPKKVVSVGIEYNYYTEQFRVTVPIEEMLNLAGCKAFLLTEIPYILHDALMGVVVQRLRYSSEKWRDINVKRDVSRGIVPKSLLVCAGRNPKLVLEYVVAFWADVETALPDYLKLLGLEQGVEE